MFRSRYRYTSGRTQLIIRRHKHYTKSFNISQLPDFTKYSVINPIHEGIAPYVYETMKAYPSNTKHVNQQHYYHNRIVLLHDYLQRKPNPVSLMQLAQYYDDSAKLTKTKIINSGRFVKEELAIRMAHKINILQQLPFNVINNFHFLQVYESYYNIFERFRRYPPILTLEDNRKFTEFTKEILQDFNSLNLPHLIMGALECTILGLYPQEEMDKLLSKLLRARISRRLIVEEHISVTNNYMSGKKENTLVLGDIFQECSAREYINNASLMCEKFVKDMYDPQLPMPELILEGDVDLKFYFLPTHLKYLFGEILRNIYEASVKLYLRKGQNIPEPIVVTIAQNEDSYIFRFSDKAGGIPHNLNDANIWSFGKSSDIAKESLSNFHKLPGLQKRSIYEEEAVHNRRKASYMLTSLQTMHISNLDNLEGTVFSHPPPLLRLMQRAIRFRLGIGLAMCKVYAEYWNGDFTLHSIPDYGTDTVLKLGNLMKQTEKRQLDKV